ncbi:D-glycero-alpha-D-manno-heptose-1,7-bisphosphate 7-phosphatase [Pseudorhodoferax sp.]|uniref:D-glycero-alpha-D-manno-heptose-1,7-bisphosphate 7-phosphatase n=1 Tax=Pseudorhodoferax sp. TaxID=1993553 RepID=UPI0039E44F9E
MSLRSALFLDRDGVVNVDHGYVYRTEDFHFIDGIFDVVSAANRAGYVVVIVTNQAGIGRGYYSEADFFRLMDWVRTEFERRGCRIDAVYFCPDHPEHGIGPYRRDTDFRKPGPGMLLRAAEEIGIALETSIMVGDKASDMEAARAAGVPTRLCFGNAREVGEGVGIGSLTDVLRFFESSATCVQVHQ